MGLVKGGHSSNRLRLLLSILYKEHNNIMCVSMVKGLKSVQSVVMQRVASFPGHSSL